MIFKKFAFFFLLLLSFFLFDVHPASAHRPHDDVHQVELSPTYNQDQTLFVTVRGVGLKSTNGGKTWQRLAKGLDNRYNLFSLAISPQDKNIIFLSSLGDGIYKSEDEGASWKKVNKGLETLKIDLLAISPHSPKIVLAAGQENGLYETKDGGESWKRVLEQDNNKVTSIAFSLDNEAHILIGNNKGSLYLSENEGEIWKESFTFKNTGAVTAIAFSRNFVSDKTFLIGTEKGGMFKTTNKGLSFSKINQGLADASITDVLISPGSEEDKNLTVFTSTWHEGVFLSTDGGKSWQKYSKGLTKSGQADEPQFHEPHFNNLKISDKFNQDKTMFLAGFNGLFKSNDGGKQWQEIYTLSPRLIVGLALSPDYKNDSTVAIVNYVGEAYISHDKGVTWKPMQKGLEIPRFTKNFKKLEDDPRRFFDIAFSPNYRSDKTIFLGLLRDYFLKSNDRGKHWNIVTLRKVPKSFVRGSFVAVSPSFATDQAIYLATNRGTLYKSSNAGQKFSILGNIGQSVAALVISPDFLSDKTLYASGSGGVYKTVDGGNSWQPITNNPDLGGIIWGGLAISPNYKVDKTLIAGTDLGVFQTRDGGTSWEKIADSAYGGDGIINAIAISPNYQSDQTFAITVQGRGSFKTVDGGKTFAKIGDDSIVLSRVDTVPSASIPIKFSPSYSMDNTLYGFGSVNPELYKSIDGGKTWKTIAIPKYENKLDEFLTFIKLVFDIYPLLKFVIAGIIGGLSYLGLSYMGLEKRLPLSKTQVRLSGSSVAFVIVLIILFL